MKRFRELVPDALVVHETGRIVDLLATRAFGEGKFYIQDEASQMVARLANPQTGERILDLCSAPGGKATHLAELSGGKASVVASDTSAQRLGKVRENIARLKTPSIETVPYETVAQEVSTFDCVLVDAPCSGLGTLRRNPEIRYRCSKASIEGLAREQAKILNTAARLMRPGGRIVYSTCTISDAENSDVVAAFLSEHPNFECALSGSEVFSGLNCPDGFYRTWPARLKMDGFEAVVLEQRH